MFADVINDVIVVGFYNNLTLQFFFCFVFNISSVFFNNDDDDIVFLVFPFFLIHYLDIIIIIIKK